MGEWKEISLDKIAEITSAKRIYYSEYVNEGVPFYRSKEVIDKFNRREINTELFISEKRYQDIKDKFGVPQKDDILLTSVGSLGIPYLIKEGDRFYFKDGNLTWFRKINKNIIDVNFLYIWINSKVGKQKLDEITIGSTQAALTINGLKTIEILIPPLNEQKSIAAVISSLDDKIDLLHRQNATLEKMAESLFRKWFVEEAKEDWKEGKLSDFGKVITGKTPSKNNPDFWGMKYQFITPTDFKYFGMFANFTTRFLSEIGWIKMKNLQLPANSILVTCIGSDMGKVCISSESCITNQQLNSVVLKDENYLGYIYEYLKSQYLNLRNIAFGGTTMPIINKTDFENIIVPIPSNELVLKFQNSWSSFSNKIKSNQTQIRTLTKLRDTLLPKLMSGEVKVK